MEKEKRGKVKAIIPDEMKSKERGNKRRKIGMGRGR